jgi:tRNA-2-methylthio-N6-dimethylallyladenosine synthase
MDILLEKPGKLPGQLVGRSPYLQSVHVMAQPEAIGSIVKATITDTGSNTLFGVLGEDAGAASSAALSTTASALSATRLVPSGA